MDSAVGMPAPMYGSTEALSGGFDSTSASTGENQKINVSSNLNIGDNNLVLKLNEDWRPSNNEDVNQFSLTSTPDQVSRPLGWDRNIAREDWMVEKYDTEHTVVTKSIDAAEVLGAEQEVTPLKSGVTHYTTVKLQFDEEETFNYDTIPPASPANGAWRRESRIPQSLNSRKRDALSIEASPNVGSVSPVFSKSDAMLTGDKFLLGESQCRGFTCPRMSSIRLRRVQGKENKLPNQQQNEGAWIKVGKMPTHVASVRLEFNDDYKGLFGDTAASLIAQRETLLQEVLRTLPGQDSMQDEILDQIGADSHEVKSLSEQGLLGAYESSNAVDNAILAIEATIEEMGGVGTDGDSSFYDDSSADNILPGLISFAPEDTIDTLAPLVGIASWDISDDVLAITEAEDITVPEQTSEAVAEAVTAPEQPAEVAEAITVPEQPVEAEAITVPEQAAEAIFEAVTVTEQAVEAIAEAVTVPEQAVEAVAEAMTILEEAVEDVAEAATVLEQSVVTVGELSAEVIAEAVTVMEQAEEAATEAVAVQEQTAEAEELAIEAVAVQEQTAEAEEQAIEAVAVQERAAGAVAVQEQAAEVVTEAVTVQEQETITAPEQAAEAMVEAVTVPEQTAEVLVEAVTVTEKAAEAVVEVVTAQKEAAEIVAVPQRAAEVITLMQEEIPSTVLALRASIPVEDLSIPSAIKSGLLESYTFDVSSLPFKAIEIPTALVPFKTHFAALQNNIVTRNSTGMVEHITLTISLLTTTCFLGYLVMVFIRRSAAFLTEWQRRRVSMYILRLETEAIEHMVKGQFALAIAALNAGVKYILTLDGDSIRLDSAGFRHLLGKALIAHGDYTAAEEAIRTVVAYYESLSADDLHLAKVLEDLGMALQSQGEGHQDEAYNLLMRALKIYEREMMLAVLALGKEGGAFYGVTYHAQVYSARLLGDAIASADAILSAEACAAEVCNSKCIFLTNSSLVDQERDECVKAMEELDVMLAAPTAAQVTEVKIPHTSTSIARRIDVARVRFEMGLVFELSQQYEDALVIIEEALEVFVELHTDCATQEKFADEVDHIGSFIYIIKRKIVDLENLLPKEFGVVEVEEFESELAKNESAHQTPMKGEQEKTDRGSPDTVVF
jgi:tetratricopeptide (TPR) repeat protein